ncbi:CD209 antigen [Drosophila biarmipes]|uniref:CD209 antigen n=1 Tax=Drosophila biarmipes TaxID=125945 RepID=UPI0007E642DB|nr:CD209 antigen [Drosophila biarmipes]
MFKIEAYILYSLIAWNLPGSQSQSQDEARSVCLLQDPPNQCGEFCLSVLEPLLDHIAKHQEQWNTSDALQLNDTQAKLDRIQTKLDGQTISLGDSLRKVIAQDFQDKLTRLESHQTDIQKSLGSQLEVQINLEKQQKTLAETFKNVVPENFAELLGKMKEEQTSLQETLKKIPLDIEEKLATMQDQQKSLMAQLEDQKSLLDALRKTIPENLGESLSSLQENLKKIPEGLEGRLERLENSQKDVQTKMETQQAKLVDTLNEIYAKVYWPKFERIGSRLLFFDRQKAYTWLTAVSTCREMDGYIASIKDQEELDAIKGKLAGRHYWLGINDRDTRGDYVSHASGKKAPFLIWKSGEPNHGQSDERCVELVDGEMNDEPCSKEKFLICQTNSDL